MKKYLLVYVIMSQVFKKRVIFKKPATFNNKVTVKKPVVVRNKLTVNRESSLGGNVKIGGNLTLDGTTVTSTAAELNYLKGVTSNIQNQINNISNGDVITDGTATLTVGTLMATIITDGTATLSGGALSGLVRFEAGILTDGVATLTAGTLTATTLTDGVAVLTDGTLTATNVIIGASAPTAESDGGTVGEIRVDDNYLYVYTSGSVWKKLSLESF